MSAKDLRITRLERELADARYACGRKDKRLAEIGRVNELLRRQLTEERAKYAQLVELTPRSNRTAETNLAILASVGDYSQNDRDSRDMALRSLQAFLSMLWSAYIRRGEEQAATKAENVDLRQQLTREYQCSAVLDREVVRLRTSGRIIAELISVFGCPSAMLEASRLNSLGRFRITGHPRLDIVVDMAGPVEFRNRNTGRKASGHHEYGLLDAQAFTAIEALLPDVALKSDIVPPRLWAELFVADEATISAQPSGRGIKDIYTCPDPQNQEVAPNK